MPNCTTKIQYDISIAKLHICIKFYCICRMYLVDEYHLPHKNSEMNIKGELRRKKVFLANLNENVHLQKKREARWVKRSKKQEREKKG